MSGPRNKGRVFISDELILGWLQFSGGRIIDISHSNDSETTEIVIEHEEMPETNPGEYAPIVNPSYITYQDCEGHKVAIREPLRG